MVIHYIYQGFLMASLDFVRNLGSSVFPASLRVSYYGFVKEMLTEKVL